MPYHLSPDKKTVLGADGKPVPGGKHKTRGQALAHLRALEVNVSDAKSTMKHGADFVKEMKVHAQDIHDKAMKLGADCGMAEGEGKAAKFAAKYAEAMGMNPDQYAAQECNDIQDACNVLYGLASLASGETYADEPAEVKRICDLMRGLVEFISGEIDEVEENGGNAAEENEIGEGKWFKAEGSPEDYLIVEDKEKPTTWHLRVKKGGKPDHGLMGGAWAALHEGYRGNTYDGPGKQEAIAKLTALYKQEKMDTPKSGKSIEVPAYIKSLHLSLDEQRFRDVLAVKFVGRNEIHGYSNLWGDPKTVDLDAEYFTKSTNFWDKVLGLPRPLTWNHAQDKSTFKGSAIIGEISEFGDDDIGRWYNAVLDRSHEYRSAIGKLVDSKSLGTSSDSAPQYVEREKVGKAVWLKTWPLFAAALTDVPCEPRMLDIGSPIWKAIGVDAKLLQGRIAEAGLDVPREEMERRAADLELLKAHTVGVLLR